MKSRNDIGNNLELVQLELLKIIFSRLSSTEIPKTACKIILECI